MDPIRFNRGTSIHSAIGQLIHEAKRTRGTVVGLFNDVELTAWPDSTADRLLSHYRLALQAREVETA